MSDIIETIDYRGFQIDIVPDLFAGNPWEEFDCEPPMIVISGASSIPGRNDQIDYGLELCPPELTRKQIKDNLQALRELLSIRGSFLSFCSEYAYSYRSNYEDATQLINESIEQYCDGISDSDTLELIAALYNMQGIPAICVARSGYSQGDYIELLIVGTKEYSEKIGTVPTLESLEHSADLYANYAFGSVYGFNIESIDDSCFGFYGYDHEKSGLLECARDVVDSHIEHARQAQIKQVKAWIKSKVPLIYRGAFQ